MSELKRNINTPHKRGFYVRMKISSNKHKKNIYYFYFKWLLWGSLSLYFFTSYFIASSKNPSLSSSPTPPSNQTTKQPLSVKPSKSQLSTNPIIKFGDLGDLKVYVYDLPPKYNSDWLRNNRCEAHLFAAEVAIHKALMSSDVRTLDPIEADFFFVPVYVSCNFSTVNGFPSLGHARPLLNSAIQLVSSQMPYWNRSDGSDHVFVASHDYGACFHATEDVAIKEGIPGFLKNSIILQTFGVKFGHPCQEVEHVLIPPYVSPQKISSTIAKSKGNGKRDIFVFFRGKMEVHPKNINGRYYSKGIRSVIWHKFNRKRKFYLKREKFSGYQSEIQRSKFCLCPLGWAPWSPRLVESVALGCVPVIIADGIRLPYSNIIEWSKISLTIPEKDIVKLAKILDNVANTNLTRIQRNLWDPKNRLALLFNERVQERDATWQILSALSKRLQLSFKRSRGVIDELKADT